MTKRFATTAETIRINDILKEHLKPEPNGREFRFDEGWDDSKVAAAAGAGLNAGHVIRVRHEIFGRLSAPPGNETRIAALEAQMQKLTENFGTSVLAFNRLCDGVSASKLSGSTMDARSLKLPFVPKPKP